MNIQNKFKKTNTIYKITKDMDLEGSTLIIPVGCTLDFQGGSFKNGTIEGNGTAIQSELRRIFDDNIVLEGMWNVKEAYPEWFGGKGDGVTDNTQAINNCIKYFTNTYISAGTYITNQIDDIPSFRTINGCGKKSIIQANPKMNLTNSYLLRTKNGGSGITFSNFVLLGGANSTESNYKIGGIYLRSTSNDVNDQWDTRNIIQNVEIKYCYAASIYVGTYQRENKISNCFITHTTNVGINCMGTDNMIIGCTVASSHHEGKDWVQLDKGLIVPFITQYYGQGITLGYDATLSDRKLTFDNQRHLLKYGYDSKWNYVSTLLSGTTANRPSADLNMPVGLQYFDTTISKPIYWTGTGWVDSTGVTV